MCGQSGGAHGPAIATVPVGGDLTLFAALKSSPFVPSAESGGRCWLPRLGFLRLSAFSCGVVVREGRGETVRDYAGANPHRYTGLVVHPRPMG